MRYLKSLLKEQVISIMIDRHVHIERGPYTKEWLNKFIDTALKRGMTKLGIIEHTHRFIEFKHIYDSINVDTDYGKYQKFIVKS